MTKHYGPAGLCFETGTPDPEEARLQQEAWAMCEAAMRHDPNTVLHVPSLDMRAREALHALDAYRAQHRDEALMERMNRAYWSAGDNKSHTPSRGLRAVLALLRKEGWKEPGA